jgi:hypothetical protein
LAPTGDRRLLRPSSSHPSVPGTCHSRGHRSSVSYCLGMLDLIRKYALERLEAGGEGDGARRSHAATTRRLTRGGAGGAEEEQAIVRAKERKNLLDQGDHLSRPERFGARRRAEGGGTNGLRSHARTTTAVFVLVGLPPVRRMVGVSGRAPSARPRNRRHSAQERAAVRALSQTKSLRSLAADSGVSHETVRAAIRNEVAAIA